MKNINAFYDEKGKIKDVFVSRKIIEKYVTFFHASNHQLSKTDYFTFVPQTPRSPYEDNYQDVIEDDFSKRISVSNNIKDILKAKSIMPKSYIYGIFEKNPKGLVDVAKKTSKCAKKLFYKKENNVIKYGEINFNLFDWIEYVLINPNLYHLNKSEFNALKKIRDLRLDARLNRLSSAHLPLNIKKIFTGCVPDAKKTNELWITQKTKFWFIGTYSLASDDIELSSTLVKKLSDILNIKQSKR